MNIHWIKHKNLYKRLIAFISMCLVIEIGRMGFQYYAQQTKFSGSIIGSHWNSELPPILSSRIQTIWKTK